MNPAEELRALIATSYNDDPMLLAWLTRYGPLLDAAVEPVPVDEIEKRDKFAAVFRRIIDTPSSSTQRAVDCANYVIRMNGAAKGGGG